MSRICSLFGISKTTGVHIWDVESGQHLETVEGQFIDYVFHPREYLFLINGDPSILTFKWRSGKLLHRSFVSDRPLVCIGATADKKYLVSFFLFSVEFSHQRFVKI